MNTNINPVLIPSSTNSTSSQVKQSSQQIGTIGNKTTYNATTPQPSPVKLFQTSFINSFLNITLFFFSLWFNMILCLINPSIL